MLMPTGVGAAVGGYAGDARPAARLLSRALSTLLTHPNVLNGALMYWPLPNALYVEGIALDEFAAGRLALRPTRPHANNIALVLDAGMGHEAVTCHLHAADAVRATLALRVTSYTVADAPLGVELRHAVHSPKQQGLQRHHSRHRHFCIVGTISRPDALLRACARRSTRARTPSRLSQTSPTMKTRKSSPHTVAAAAWTQVLARRR
jgi:hypothetical protein